MVHLIITHEFIPWPWPWGPGKGDTPILSSPGSSQGWWRRSPLEGRPPPQTSPPGSPKPSSSPCICPSSFLRPHHSNPRHMRCLHQAVLLQLIDLCHIEYNVTCLLTMQCPTIWNQYASATWSHAQWHDTHMPHCGSQNCPWATHLHADVWYPPFH